MSLEEALSKLQQDDSPTSVDVAMALLDKEKVELTANVKNTSMLNSMDLYISYFGDCSPENKAYSPKCALVMQTLRTAIIKHSLIKGGYRAGQIVQLFTGLQAYLSMGTQPVEETKGGGLLGRKR